MKINFAFTFLICIFSSVFLPTCNAAREVTNQEIRDAIISLVNSYNLLDNKLERHEHRERALGELIKRGLQSLQKGQKVYEPMKGIFSRLDERVSQIETMLIAQEEKYNVQTDKLGEALEAIFKWMTEKNACEQPKSNPDDNENKQNQKDFINKIDNLSDNVKELTKSSKQLLEQTEKIITTKISSTDEVLTKLEEKLSNFYINAQATAAPELKNTEFEDQVTKYLDEIVTNVNALNVPDKDSYKGLLERDREYIQSLTNTTLHAIEDMRSEVLTASDKTFTKITSRIKESNENINNTVNKVIKSISESTDLAEKYYSNLNESFNALHEGLDVFNKFDKILLTTSDYVLDTQRKVEYGSHQVLMKVSELVRLQNSELNATLQKRFDDIDSSIVNNHLEALQNLSSTMELEISHVWRQIEIMHNEMSYSKDALTKLQGQTEAYVNGTFTTMDSMEGKVSQITGRMTEVDSNLNYLLGRLSLVTQEFNEIKSGLGSALDQIRNSFQTVQEKIKNVGPGPHAIPRDEYETDINLLQGP